MWIDSSIGTLSDLSGDVRFGSVSGDIPREKQHRSSIEIRSVRRDKADLKQGQLTELFDSGCGDAVGL